MLQYCKKSMNSINPPSTSANILQALVAILSQALLFMHLDWKINNLSADPLVSIQGGF